MRNGLIVAILLFAACGQAWSQQKNDLPEKAAKDSGNQKKTALSEDPYRLSYQDVFANMHYNQPLRPQVHYTAISGQIADATGLVRYKGKYHLFYMFDEWSKRRRDNKNWGHAVSEDCIFWEQQPVITNSIIDNRPGSGSGIIDWNNSLGLQKGVEKTMVVFYTDYGRGVCIAFSKDAGKTWIRHKQNPVLEGKEGRRDPNVFWYKADQSWRMVIYDSPGFSFYKSTNLVEWQFLSKMDGFFECPDLIEMPLRGKEELKKWVLIDGNGAYYIGDFDGTQFKPDGKKHSLGKETLLNNSGGHANYYTKDIYATQTWKQSYEGDGPFYQLAFMMINEPPSHDRTWSQQMIFPVELTLRMINKEMVLCRNPIDGIKQLRTDAKFWKQVPLIPNKNPLQVEGDVLETIADIDIGKSREIVFDIRGEKAVYNTEKKKLFFLDSEVDVLPHDNKIRLRFIIDRNSVEVYANQGEASITRLFYPEAANKKLRLYAVGGAAEVSALEVYRLESIWLKREQELGYTREQEK